MKVKNVDYKILLYIYFDMYNKFKYHQVNKPFF